MSSNMNSPRAGSGGAGIVGGERNTSGPGPDVMDAETLIGNDVVNTVGEDLGDIDAIMLDVRSGRVAYAVLASGGFLGLGEKLFAVPWGALTLDADRKCFILDITAERLKQAPGFDKDHWPSMADMTWAQGVHDFYQIPHYWR